MLKDDRLAGELVTSAQAAEILDVGIRQFQRLVRTGGPDPYTKKGQNSFYRLADILTFKELRENNVGFYALVSEARRSIIESRAVRHEMDQLRAVLRIGLPPLPMDKDSIISTVFQAEDALDGPDQLPKEELLKWAQVLHGIHEAYYEAIALYINTKEPWRGLLNLGNKLCKGQPFDLTRVDRELESIYALLHAGLRIARQAAFFYVQGKHGKTLALNMFPEAKNCVHEEILLIGSALVP